MDRSDTQDIIANTNTIIFLGTPHQGSHVSFAGAVIAALGSFLGSAADLPLSLRNHHGRLSDLESRFAKSMRGKANSSGKADIFCFYEERQTFLFRWLNLGLVSCLRGFVLRSRRPAADAYTRSSPEILPEPMIVKPLASTQTTLGSTNATGGKINFMSS